MVSPRTSPIRGLRRASGKTVRRACLLLSFNCRHARELGLFDMRGRSARGVGGSSAQPVAERKPVFLASLGPGLVFGGGWLVPAIP